MHTRHACASEGFNTYDNAIWKRINEAELSGGMGLTKRNEFLLDFERATDAELDALNANNGELIDYWDSIKFFNNERKKIIFLETFRFIKSDQHLLDHIIKGHVYANGKAYGVHSKIAEDNGMALITVTEQANFDGVYKGTVKVKNSNGVYIDKIKNNGDLQESTFFKNDWSDERIIEEITYAYSTKVYTGIGNKYHGLMSNLTKCEICINGETKLINSTTKIKTAFPVKQYRL